MQMIFLNSEQKSKNIVELGDWCGGMWSWHFSWRWSWFQWEMRIVQQLKEALEGWEPKVGKEDSWLWKNNDVKTFMVKEVYASLITYGLEDVSHAECKEHYSQHFRILRGAKARRVWGVMCVAVIWLLWNRRNYIIFNEASLDAEKALDSIKYQAWSWCNAYVKDFKLSLYIRHLDLPNCHMQIR
ncbi:hypothetical protein HKD37_03G007844 [Glycine soja]